MTAAAATAAHSSLTKGSTTHSRPVPLLDQLVQALARLVPSRFGVINAGVFLESGPGSSSWWDAWREPSAFTVRLGRVEIQVDLKEAARAAEGQKAQSGLLPVFMGSLLDFAV